MKKLEQYGMCTVGDIALCSGKTRICCISCSVKMRSCSSTMRGDGSRAAVANIKAYKPSTNSISTGQVLACPYTADKGTSGCPRNGEISWYSIW